jgi:hypothetical protein
MTYAKKLAREKIASHLGVEEDEVNDVAGMDIWLRLLEESIKEAVLAQQKACLKAAQETFYERGNCWDEEVDDAILNAEVQP